MPDYEGNTGYGGWGRGVLPHSAILRTKLFAIGKWDLRAVYGYELDSPKASRHLWKTWEAGEQRKSRTRQKHSLNREWSIPDRALLKACWEQTVVSSWVISACLQSCEKESSSIAEIVILTLLMSIFMTVKKGSFPQFLVKAPFFRRAFSRSLGSRRVLQTISATSSISFMQVAPFVKNVYKKAARRFHCNCQDGIVPNFTSIYCALWQ